MVPKAIDHLVSCYTPFHPEIFAGSASTRRNTLVGVGLWIEEEEIKHLFICIFYPEYIFYNDSLTVWQAYDSMFNCAYPLTRMVGYGSV